MDIEICLSRIITKQSKHISALFSKECSKALQQENNERQYSRYFATKHKLSVGLNQSNGCVEHMGESL